MCPLKKENSNNQGPAINFSAIYKGTLVTLVISLILSILVGIIYYLSSLSESTLPWMASGILCLSVFIGGGLAANWVGAKGLYHGLGVGVVYFILVWLVAGLFLPGSVSLVGFASKLAMSLAAGSIGGVLGVGLSS